MLEVKKLCRRFGPINAVNDVSFHAEKGDVLGFLGPNGAGKTTTMRMITGFLPPTSGTAIVETHDVVKDPISAKKMIGYLPENAPVYSDMTVWNYLKFVAEIRGFNGMQRIKKINETIAKCRLDTVLYQTVGTLSKGFNQRVCLAQALLHDPPVLIMDEPTDGLDPNQKHVVRSMIRDMSRDKTIVISTHILEEVDAVCTRTIIIRNGSIVANESPAELKARSKIHGAIEIILGNPPSDIKSQLENLESADAVEAGDNRYVVFPRKPDRLFEQTMQLVKHNNAWQVKGLKVLEGRLDEVFRDLTRPVNK